MRHACGEQLHVFNQQHVCLSGLSYLCLMDEFKCVWIISACVSGSLTCFRWIPGMAQPKNIPTGGTFGTLAEPHCEAGCLGGRGSEPLGTGRVIAGIVQPVFSMAFRVNNSQVSRKMLREVWRSDHSSWILSMSCDIFESEVPGSSVAGHSSPVGAQAYEQPHYRSAAMPAGCDIHEEIRRGSTGRTTRTISAAGVSSYIKEIRPRRLHHQTSRIHMNPHIPTPLFVYFDWNSNLDSSAGRRTCPSRPTRCTGKVYVPSGDGLKKNGLKNGLSPTKTAALAIRPWSPTVNCFPSFFLWQSLGFLQAIFLKRSKKPGILPRMLYEILQPGSSTCPQGGSHDFCMALFGKSKT